jgi:glyoxylase-like metal-dependent hydrolase (beta-lactamase superfamily II)
MMKSVLSRMALIGAVAMFAVTNTQASAPFAKGQAPGYYRMMLGAFEVTALSDGTVDLPMDKLLKNTTPSQIEKALSHDYLNAPVETSVNAYLINTGSKLVLVDTGAGHLFGPTLGKMANSLKAAGYQPEQVDEIYITHMHPDHVGGLAEEGKAVFPNAVVRADQEDAKFWLNLENATPESKPFFQGAMASLTPYIQAGKFKPFSDNTELMPGIKTLKAHGHTKGHTLYQIESQKQKLLIWGDLLHAKSVQFAEPDVAIQYDTDPVLAVADRKKAFAEAAKEGYWVAAAHIPFPGIGHVQTESKGYSWIPANYSQGK